MLRDAGFRARFGREVRALAHLSHPHVCPILDVGEHAGVPFAVLRHLAGGSLLDRRPRRADGQSEPMPLNNQLLSWLLDVARALDFVHGQGHIHRDVKPGNILFDAMASST